MLFDTIAELIAERTDCDIADIKPESKFSDLGIDSVSYTHLSRYLKEKRR